MSFADVKAYFDRIHWVQAIVLCVMIICATGAPVLFFVMVPPEVLTILVGLPWLTILGPGVTAVLAAIAALRGFTGPSLLRPKGGETTQTTQTQTTVVREATKIERDDTHEVG